MKLYIKDNNVYYYHYKIFNGEISFTLFAIIFIIIFFNKNLIEYVSYGSLAIPIIGNYDGYLKYKEYNLIGIFLGSILVHMIFFYPLINFKKYFKPNFIQFLSIILGLFIIYFLPYWPYSTPRTTMALILISVYIFITLLYCYFFDYKFSDFLH